MVPRRQQTNPTMEQPVRLYKFIAFTFLFLTIALLGVIVLMSAKRAVITIESRPSPVNVTTKVAVNGGSEAIAGQVVSTLVSETATFAPTGTREEPAIATGTVQIHNETGAAQALVRTTRLLTETGVLFRLNERVLVPAGGTAEVEVYADQPGAAGNIGPARFTIPGLRSDKQKEIYAVSGQAMTGGTRAIGVVSQEDLEAAEKQLLARLAEAGQKQLIAAQTEGRTAEESNGVFTVIQSAFKSDVKVGEEVSEFVLTGQATIAGVFFEAAAVQASAREQLLKRAVDDTEVIEESTAPPTVTIAAVDLEAGTATLEVAHAGTAMLNPESKQLEKNIFFGKNKDEVRRYVLKLDHVNGVEVKFRPAWARTVPAVAEQVTVVVKQIE